jgi:ABC-type polysaccharide/polyol phosphate transport system, ATPase component
MSDTVIKVENISKFYQLGLINHGTLAKDLQGWWAKIRGKEDPNSQVSLLNSQNNNAGSDFIYALKDVSFDVKQGEVLGIIGANGAGKSTLLKILSRVTSPTSGCIKIKGRIGSLLEVGTGFHPELTGRENIYLNGAILGMRKHEIDKKLDEIIDFSGVEKFIDTPVKRYSSGMYVRLAFAVAAHLDPEILVVDEVLAVGDAEFQKKALGKMQDVSRGEGRTVLFVSHNMAAVRQLCKKAVVLDNGQIVMSGQTDEAVDCYLKSTQMEKTSNYFVVTDEYRDKGHAQDVSFVSFKLLKKDLCYSCNEPITIQIKLHANKDCKDCHINCTIWNAEKQPVGSVVSFDGFKIEKDEDKLVEYTIKNPGLAAGMYTYSISVGSGDITTGLTIFDAVRDFMTFEIDRLDDSKYFTVWAKSWGSIYLQSTTREIK